MTTKKVTHICDRCGNSITFEYTDTPRYAHDWQAIKLGQTGAELDLCNNCNLDLYKFMVDKGATNMKSALFRRNTTIV